MAERILGIDAGGSGSRVVLIADCEVTELPAGPPMNALLTNGFAQQLEKIIRESGATAVGIGMPGMRSARHSREVGRTLSKRCGVPVRVTGDGETAQRGAFLGAPGVVVMAGTGSNAVGRDGSRMARAGGHGFLLGDEGSAYWLGQTAARTALYWEDGMGGSAAIHDAVVSTAGCPLDELIIKVNTHSAERHILTPLAPVLTALARTDPVARQITEQAADHLAALAEAVQRRLGPLPVAATGGVFNSEIIWDRFAARTGAVRAQASPAVGAALLAGAPPPRPPPMSDNPKSEYPKMEEFRRLVEGAVEGAGGLGGPAAGSPLGRGVPGVVAALGRGGTTLATCVAGQADTLRPRPMTAGTVFDIASLTKVVATTTASLALIGGGRLALGGAVTAYLPEATWPAEVTIWHLLTHTSGLPGSVKFYQHCQTRAELFSELFRTPLEAPPGTRVVYSDLGFMALGEIVAAVADEPLDAAVRRLVTGPLRMDSTGYTPSGPPERFAATEPRGDGVAWTGVVHDENARVMDAVAGHAGLFSTAADLTRFAQWWVGSGDGPVPAALRREATTCQTDGLPGVEGYPGRRGLGWVCPGDRYDILGGAWPPTAVSHTGFTGTSLALDHVSGIWLVVLTNAVHFGRDATAIKALRRALHAAAIPARGT